MLFPERSVGAVDYVEEGFPLRGYTLAGFSYCSSLWYISRAYIKRHHQPIARTDENHDKNERENRAVLTLSPITFPEPGAVKNIQ